jgi:TonB family protein
MPDKNKNIKNLLADIFRYHANELSGDERNSLEREFQKDPFTEEAAEGFRSISEQEALKDITELQKRLKKKTSGRSGYIIYRIAASIAILIAVSAVFIFIDKDRQSAQLAENSIQSPKSETPDNKLSTEQDTNETNTNSQARKTEKKSAGSMAGSSGPKQIKPTIIISEPALKEKMTNDSIPSIKVIPPEIYASDKSFSASARAMSKDRSESLYNLKGKVISSEDNLPVPGANIIIKGTKTGTVTNIDGNFNISIPDSTGKTLIANYIGMESKEFIVKPDKQVEVKLDPSLSSLSEVVVVGYGVSNEETDKKEADTGLTPPQPSTGKLKFNKYIQSNLHRPDSSTRGQRVVVVLNFLVKTDGSIDSIRVERSPGKQFSDEAIRVLRSGPSWNPAQENGKAVEDDVRIRIVFR